MSELDRVNAKGTPAEITVAARTVLDLWENEGPGFLFKDTLTKPPPKRHLVRPPQSRGPDPTADPTANPIYIRIEIPEIMTPLWITIHRLPEERRSQLLVEVEDPDSQDYRWAEWYGKLTGYWWGLKAELERQGWFRKPVEAPVGDGPQPQTPTVPSAKKQKPLGGRPAEGTYDWAAAEVKKDRSMRDVWKEWKKKGGTSSFEAFRQAVYRRKKK